ncbi:MAG: Uma2 family endonuclease, partial [Desulfobacterales bacterium]|nr:Uma2 family endonuclease [Desulfobacterales bacterium]
MALPLLKNEYYTYADYLTWTDDERWELIDGEPYNMSPAPSTAHQRVLMKFINQIENFLSDRKCEAFPAPFDVRFPGEVEAPEDIIDVVQPDISVICDPSKIDEKGCLGAPDFIAEIISPSTA